MKYRLIKVCGMREAVNIREVEALGPDWMGFIFWPKSSRYVSKAPEHLPHHCKRVGVFVDQPVDEVVRTADDYTLDIIQLHGHESPDYIRVLRQNSHSPAVIKAFSIATATDMERCKDYEGIADYFLFDTKTPLVGGSGRQFDWTILSLYTGQTPFLLSGGIGPDDAGRLRAFRHDKCIGIDLNSRFEAKPALKDVGLLKPFIQKIRQL